MSKPKADTPIIPRNYEELQQQYGDLIRSLLLKRNKVERNLEDLHSYVWVRLLEAKLLDKFQLHVQKQRPRVLSAIQACDMLGVTWTQWMAAMSAFHAGTPCYHDGHPLVFRIGGWMPTPINRAEFEISGVVCHLEPTALFAYQDIEHLASIDTFGDLLGQDVQDGILCATRREVKILYPEVKVTKSKFRNYLTMSVLNHFANFCRTQTRRHKERPQPPVAYHEEETATVWEATLEDTTSVDADTMIALSEAREMLADTLFEHLDEDVMCQPVEEFSDSIFSMVENGSTILQALKTAAVPPKARKAILNRIRSHGKTFGVTITK